MKTPFPILWPLLIFFFYFFALITELEPDILECEVKWALESISMNKASGSDRILAELFKILKDDLICQQVRKTQLWPQD